MDSSSDSMSVDLRSRRSLLYGADSTGPGGKAAGGRARSSGIGSRTMCPRLVVRAGLAPQKAQPWWARPRCAAPDVASGGRADVDHREEVRAVPVVARRGVGVEGFHGAKLPAW